MTNSANLYNVKQLAALTGITRRTLHYYDQIGLLPPTSVAANGYRHYDHSAALRLQQILFYRELGLSLSDIRRIIDAPDFDQLQALHRHRQALIAHAGRLQALIHTIDHTIQHLQGMVDMQTDELFTGFTEEKQRQYEQQARQSYGDEEVDASMHRWNSYLPDRQAAIRAESDAIYRDLLHLLQQGHAPGSPETQSLITRWHEHLRYFYEPDTARMRALAQLYAEDPAFSGQFSRMHPDLPLFLRDAIIQYCDILDAL